MKIKMAINTLGIDSPTKALLMTIYESTNCYSYQDINIGICPLDGFTTGTGNLRLSSVTLGMAAGRNGSGNFFVKLYNSVNGRPGKSLITLSGEANPINEGDYTYSGSYKLNPNTTYWIVAGVRSGNGSYVCKFGSQYSKPTKFVPPGFTELYNRKASPYQPRMTWPAVMTVKATAALRHQSINLRPL
jgi:hypothetical protein